MPNFRSILPAELSGNAIQRISKQWALPLPKSRTVL